MKKSMYVLLLILLLLGGGMMFFYKSVDKVNVVSTWMWDTYQLFEKKDAYFTFLEEKDITVLYVQIDPTIDIDTYGSFIREARERGIDVIAMDGAPDWVYQTGELEAKLQWLKEYQKSAEQESQFKGLLLDVEPYLLDEWDKDQMTLLNGYVTIMDEASRFAKEHELPFEMAIPFWFHELEKDGQPLLPFLTPLVDTFVIMSYRTELEGENGLHALVSPFFQQLPGNIVLTLETETLEGEERAISFAEKDYQQLNDFIRKLNNHYEQYESFQGVSVHHLDSWMKLMQQNEENR